MDSPKNITLEVYPHGDNAIVINELTNEQAQEYFFRMEPGTDFQFFREMSDGSRKKFNYRLIV